jgi:hypothetical protein
MFQQGRSRLGRSGLGAIVAALGAALLLAGCGGDPGGVAGGKEMASDVASASGGAAPPGMLSPAAQAAAAAQPADAPAAAGEPEAPKTVARRIIYTAELHLVTPNLPAFEQELRKLVRREQGYISGADVSAAPAAAREGHWTLRVPVARYDAFLPAVAALAELERQSLQSQDVGEEYYDLQARLKSKQVEEERLLRHLQQSTARLTDILAVERELGRVRGEIERMQGRIRYLSHQTELTTIQVFARQATQYLPAERPNLMAQVGRVFSNSLGAVGDTLVAAFLVGVAILPWAALLAAIGLPIWLVVRRRRSRGAGL